MDNSFDKVEEISKKLNIMLKKAQENNSEANISNLKMLVGDLEQEITTIENNIDDMDEDIQNPARQRLKMIQSDYNLKRVQINKLDDQQKRKENFAKFSTGQLHGQEARKAERDMVVDLHKETDEQGLIVKEIGNDMKETVGNLKEAGIAVKEQDQQIGRIHYGVNEASGTVLRTDKRINEMNRRNYCLKVMLHLLVLLLFVIDIGFLIYKLMKKTSK